MTDLPVRQMSLAEIEGRIAEARRLRAEALRRMARTLWQRLAGPGGSRAGRRSRAETG